LKKRSRRFLPDPFGFVILQVIFLLTIKTKKSLTPDSAIVLLKNLTGFPLFITYIDYLKQACLVFGIPKTKQACIYLNPPSNNRLLK